MEGQQTDSSRRKFFRKFGIGIISAPMIVTNLSVDVIKPKPDNKLKITNPEYSRLCELYDNFSMMDNQWPINNCYENSNKNDYDRITWREWNLDVLREDKDVIPLLKKLGFNPPEHLL